MCEHQLCKVFLLVKYVSGWVLTEFEISTRNIYKKKNNFPLRGFLLLNFMFGISRIWIKKEERPSPHCSKFITIWKHVKNCAEAHVNRSKLQMLRRGFVTHAQIADWSLLSWWLQPGNVSISLLT